MDANKCKVINRPKSPSLVERPYQRELLKEEHQKMLFEQWGRLGYEVKNLGNIIQNPITKVDPTDAAEWALNGINIYIKSSSGSLHKHQNFLLNWSIEMKEFKELLNGQSILNETYKKFERLPNRDIKKGICDALYAMNNFIMLNSDVEVEGVIRNKANNTSGG